MPRNASGTFTLVAGNPVATGTIIESNWANSTMEDLADAMTDSLSRSGQGGMTSAFRLINGTSALPAMSFIADPTTGIYNQVAGVLGMAVSGQEVLTASATGVNVVKALAVGENVTIDDGVNPPAVFAAGVKGPRLLGENSGIEVDGSAATPSITPSADTALNLNGLSVVDDDDSIALQAHGPAGALQKALTAVNNVAGSYAQLLFNAVEKLRTTATGVRVDGSVTENGTTHVASIFFGTENNGINNGWGATYANSATLGQGVVTLGNTYDYSKIRCQISVFSLGGGAFCPMYSHLLVGTGGDINTALRNGDGNAISGSLTIDVWVDD